MQDKLNDPTPSKEKEPLKSEEWEERFDKAFMYSRPNNKLMSRSAMGYDSNIPGATHVEVKRFIRSELSQREKEITTKLKEKMLLHDKEEGCNSSECLQIVLSLLERPEEDK